MNDRNMQFGFPSVVRCSSLAVASIAVVLGLARSAGAQAEVAAQDDAQLAPITFSKLLVQLEGADQIRVAQSDLPVLLLEVMRHEGLNALGAENLVFGKDESGDAEFVLGGTLREGQCKRAQGAVDCCRAGIEWQLLDVASDQVVYRALSRFGECQLGTLDQEAIGRRLVIGALRRLVQRPRFRAELRAKAPDAQNAPPLVRFARCAAPALNMRRSADPALDATVLVKSGASHGSGLLLTAEGYVLTAAHVVSSRPPTIETRDGISLTAKLLRVSRAFDVALLKVDFPAPGHKACLPLGATATKTGAEVYAIGAPASRELAFSLTRAGSSAARASSAARS